MTVPTHLSHRPIIAIDDYDEIDGQYAGNTDVESLSIGQAQYDEDDFSVKVFRRVGGRWSRQSEELPIHRNIDLTILVVASMLEGERPISSMNEQIISQAGNQRLLAYYQANQGILMPRLKELKELLDRLL
jgi:hypothetical protein